MKIIPKEFYCISHAHDTLKIITGMLNIDFGKARPILWCNKGLYCIISRQKVQNILDAIKDQGNLPVLNQKPVNVFWWEDGELITARAAAMLLS